MSFSNFNNSYPQGSQLQNCSAGSPIGGVDSNNVFRLLKLTATGTLPTATTDTTAAQALTPAPLAPGAYAASVCLAYFTNIFTNTTGAALQITINPVLLGQFTGGNLLNMVFMKSGSTLSGYAGGRAIGTDNFAPTINQADGALKFYHNYNFQPFGAAGAGQALPLAAQPSLGTIILPAATSLECMVVAGGAVTNGGNAIYLQFSQFSY